MNTETSKTKVSIAKEFAEGTTFVVTPKVEVPDEQVVVQCAEGALKGMLWHSLRGLPKSEEGGSVDGTEAIEVKGFLLGQVELTEKQRTVTIKEIVQLPFNDQDAGDAAYFNAQDRVILERKLKSRPSLQLVGNYHSHPNHEIKLSDQDVVFLSQYLPEIYHVAVIVGPREPAVGFFLKNEDGEYTPWQEPVSRIDYVKTETKSRDKDKQKKPGFDWKPAIEVIVGEDGQITHVQGKKLPLKRIAIFSAAGVAVVALILWLVWPDPRALMMVNHQEIDFSSSGLQDEVIVLKLDRDGEFQFLVQTDDLPSWLEIDNTKGEFDFNTPGSFMLTATTSLIPPNETKSYTLKVHGSPVKGGSANSETIVITATNDMEEMEIKEDWDLPPIRVVGESFEISLPEDYTPASDEKVTIRGFSMQNNSWNLKWTKHPTGRRLKINADEFGSPLTYSRIKVEAKAVMRAVGQKKILQLESSGSREMRKTTKDWALDKPEEIDGKINLVTKPLDYTGYAVFTARRGGKTQRTSVEIEAGKPYRHVVDYTEELEKVGVTLAYVGSGGVHELRYSSPIADITSPIDLAFVACQGPTGQNFRRNHPGWYSESNLAFLGKFKGPKHMADIDPQERWGRLTILPGNNKIHDTWGDLIAIGEEIEGGRMAWDYIEKDSGDGITLKLFFVFEQENHEATLDWLFQNEDILKELEALISDRRGRLVYDFGPGYSDKGRYIVQQ